MPVVTVHFHDGEIAERITDALVSVAGSKRHAVNVIFNNVAREDFVIGGAEEYKAEPD